MRYYFAVLNNIVLGIGNTKRQTKANAECRLPFKCDERSKIQIFETDKASWDEYLEYGEGVLFFSMDQSRILFRHYEKVIIVGDNPNEEIFVYKDPDGFYYQYKVNVTLS